MLGTLLKIGSLLRDQPGAKGIRHHRYIRPAPKARKNQSISYYEVDVSLDGMVLDLAALRKLESEYDIAELYYLNYKTSDADSMKKYLFGDICRYREKKPNQDRYSDVELNFDLGNPTSGAPTFRLHSFDRGAPDASGLGSTLIASFRSCLKCQMGLLLNFFESQEFIYINFRFGPGRLHWYQLEHELKSIDKMLLSHFAKPVPGGFVLTKSLYKTIGSGKETAPYFETQALYKGCMFETLERVSDLMYAVDVSQRPMLRNGDVKIVVLPRSDDSTGASRLTARQVEEFIGVQGIHKIAGQEASLSDVSEAEEDEDVDTEENAGDNKELSEPMIRAADVDAITQFDFIFSKASASPSTPDVDLIELAGVSKSRIGELHNQIQEVRRRLEQDRVARFTEKHFGVDKLRPMRILTSINEILGVVGRDKRKYSNHILRILPKIYTGSYVQDGILLTALVETTERSVRDGFAKYDSLRYDYLLLLGLQECNLGTYEPDRKEVRMPNDIHDTLSFRLGQCLGKMARPLRVAISSFEKSHVGLLSRRISHLDDVITFQNYIDEKLVMHNRMYPDLRDASLQATRIYTSMASLETKEAYNREYCAAGFFESYFAPIPPEAASSGQSDDTVAARAEEN